MKNSKYYLITLFLIFSILFAYTLNNMQSQGYMFINFFTIPSADNHELFLPAENLIQLGQYTQDGVKPYTGRIPGIAIFYLPLRLFFSNYISFSILVFTQLVLYFSLLILLFNIFLKHITPFVSFVLCLILVLLTPYYLIPITVPEIFSIIFATFGFAILLKHIPVKSNRYFLSSGFFLMMAVTFRGYLLPAFLAITIILFFNELLNSKITKALKNTFIFLIPLILYLGLWTTRNYIATSEIILLQTSDRPYNNLYKNSVQETKSTLKLMGFETVAYYPNSPINYLLGIDSSCSELLTNQTSHYGISAEDLQVLRNKLIASFECNNLKLEQDIISLNKKYQQKIKESSSLKELYFSNALKIFIRSYTFNFTSTWGLPAWTNANPIEKTYRVLIYLLFHTLILSSTVFSITLLLQRKNVFSNLVFVTWMLSMFFTYTFLINQIEFKYFLTIVPLAILNIGGNYQSILFMFSDKHKKIGLHFY